MRKIIHYFYDNTAIWRKNTSSTYRICYNSWLRNCPDYEIKLWHDKMPEFQDMLKQSKFLRECYSRKMWAFVSDYIRYYALYHYGGIYLDTDVELLQNFDKYINNPFFVSIEGDIWYGENVPEPAVMGGEKEHYIFKAVLNLYNSDKILGIDCLMAPRILQIVLSQTIGFTKIDYNKKFKEKAEQYYNKDRWVSTIKDIDVYKNQKIYRNEPFNVFIYPSEYFCPAWSSFGPDAFTKNTVSIHWNQSSWWKDINYLKEFKEKFKIS